MNKIKSKIISKIDLIIQLTILLFVMFYFYKEIRPILVTSKFAYPTTDDYWMSMHVHSVWLETNSIFKTIGAAFTYAIGIYKTWDGNFLSMFFTALSPTVFGEDKYGITVWIIVFMILIGTIMLGYSLLHKRWKMPVINSLSISLLFTMFFLNFMTNPDEGIFWWPGVANYTLFCGLFLFSQGLFILYWEKRKIYLLVLSCIFSFMVSLGNPLTSLVNVCLLAYELIYEIIRNKKLKNFTWIVFLSALIGLLIIVSAPGNNVRIPADRISVFEVVFRSFKDGTIFLRVFIKPAVYVYLFVIALISVYSFALGKKDSVINEKLKFRFPVIFSVLIFCLYYASFAPIEYAQTSYYGRLLDVCFFVLIIALTIIDIYVCGFIVKIFKKIKLKENLQSIIKKFLKQEILQLICAAVIILGVLILGSYRIKMGSTSFKADIELQFNNIYRFNEILSERYRQLTDERYGEVDIYEPPYVSIFLHEDFRCYQDIGYYYKKGTVYKTE